MFLKTAEPSNQRFHMCESVMKHHEHGPHGACTRSCTAAGPCLAAYDCCAQAKRTSDVLFLVHMAISKNPKNPGHKPAARREHKVVAAQPNRHCSEHSERVRIAAFFASTGSISGSQSFARVPRDLAARPAWAGLTAVRLLAFSPPAPVWSTKGLARGTRRIGSCSLPVDGHSTTLLTNSNRRSPNISQAR